MDKMSNSMSIFGIIEKVSFVSVDDKTDMSSLAKVSPVLHVRMTAAWKRDESEAETSFEHQTLLWIPGQEEAQKVIDGSFVFKHQIHRFIAEMSLTGLSQNGTIRIENCLREFGQEQWLIQSYEIPIERVALSKKPTPSD